MATVTLSLDDGHPDDLRALEVMARHGLRGTVYVAFNHPGAPQIDEAGIRTLHAAGVEIGSHTMSHRVLTLVAPDTLDFELGESRRRLEELTGAAVTSLSYPLGYRNATVVAAARRAGYRLGRTQAMLRTDPVRDPMAVPMTLDVTPAGGLALLKGQLREANVTGLAAWGAMGLATDPDRLFDALMARADRPDGVFHLYARSWEMTRHGLWDRFERFCARLGAWPGARHATNTGVALSA
jgi:peptidoglycan/xylan/chitin deacetylase (PgdA/CDA1 family)